MNRVLFFLVKSLAFLPVDWLSALGKWISFILKTVNYRHAIILKNLSRSFPNKKTEQIQLIVTDFYNFLGRLIAESIKLFNISKYTLSQRTTFVNDDLLKPYLEQDQEVIVVMGHYGNWEWALLASSIHFDTEMIGIYKPLSSPFWNRKLHELRSQYGATLLSMKESTRHLLKKSHSSRLIGIIADQTPSAQEINHWIPFLNQKTPVFLGAEKLAKKLQCPVFYASVSPQKFGYYKITFELVSTFPNEYTDGEITLLHSKKLEQSIKNSPAYWLWSHRRWKHQK